MIDPLLLCLVMAGYALGLAALILTLAWRHAKQTEARPAQIFDEPPGDHPPRTFRDVLEVACGAPRSAIDTGHGPRAGRPAPPPAAGADEGVAVRPAALP